MAVSDKLGILAVKENQSLKMAALNTIVTQLENAISQMISIDVSTAVDTDTDNFVIPYDDTNDLSDRTATQMIFLELTGTPSVDFYVEHPDKAHMFLVRNNTDQVANVHCTTSQADTVNIDATGTFLLICDGTGIFDMSPRRSATGIRLPYDFEVSVFGSPGEEEVVANMLMTRDVTIPAAFAGIQHNVGTNPTNVSVFTVRKNGSIVGSLTVSQDGSLSCVSLNNLPIELEAGDILNVRAPESVDPTLADVLFSWPGETVYIT